MKVHQTTSICPRLKPVQLPLVGKCLSINSATRIFRRKAMMTGISSVRSWVIVICSLIPRAYLNSYFLAKIRTNCELEPAWIPERRRPVSIDPFTHPRWYAIQTRSWYEKRVRDQLTAQALVTFLPLWQKRSLRADRAKLLELPLFRGYLFGYFTLQ